MAERCIFSGQSCEGKLTRHHIRYRSEMGVDARPNLIPMCQGHQRWVHSKNIWGGEDFNLIDHTKIEWMKKDNAIMDKVNEL